MAIKLLLKKVAKNWQAFPLWLRIVDTIVFALFLPILLYFQAPAWLFVVFFLTYFMICHLVTEYKEKKSLKTNDQHIEEMMEEVKKMPL